jgi:tetratricopeptide (TPR) repeat protein
VTVHAQAGRAATNILAIVAILGAFGAALGMQLARDRAYAGRTREVERVLYVRSGDAARRLTLDFDALAADVYWIRAIQHYGGDRLSRTRERKYELLNPLLDLATSLDPYFTIAYRFGAIFLAERRPGGPGRPDQAIALLEKGIATQPQKWQYFHDVAFVHYWHLRDFKTAAVWFQKAAALPNAPNWLSPRVRQVSLDADARFGRGVAAEERAAEPHADRRARRNRSARQRRAAVPAAAGPALLMAMADSPRCTARYPRRSFRNSVRD